ncbi:MAG: DUF6498-containing protein [Hyphomonadaceae bacterium]
MSEIKSGGAVSWPDVVGGVAFNLIPIIGVLFWGWSAFALIFLYWLENVAIGGRTLLSIVAAGMARGPAAHAGALALGGFFTVHYGMFCFVHGIFVVTMFGQAVETHGLFDLVGVARALFAAQSNLVFGFAAIVFWQIVEFGLFLARGEAARLSPKDLMSAPYPRIVVLHLTILLGGFVLMASGWPLIGVAALAVFKAAFDVAFALGWRMDRKPGARADKPA